MNQEEKELFERIEIAEEYAFEFHDERIEEEGTCIRFVNELMMSLTFVLNEEGKLDQVQFYDYTFPEYIFINSNEDLTEEAKEMFLELWEKYKEEKEVR